MKIKLIKFNENLITPTRAHYNDAGLDCYALENITLPAFKSEITVEPVTAKVPDECKLDDNNISMTILKYKDEVVGYDHIVMSGAAPKLIPLGFGLEVPDGYMATIRPRSSMNVKGVISQIGTIDSGYRGEIKAVLINLTDKDIEIKKGDKICQIVIEPVILADFVEDLKNDRGEGGFGSTGK